MSASVRKKKLVFAVHWIIIFACMLLFHHLPLWGTVTEYGMKLLGIFIGLMWGWMFLDLLTPSLIAMMVLLTTVEDATLANICAQGLGSSNIFVMIVVMALAQYFQDSGLNRYLGDWFVSLKINVGRPWLFSAILLVATFLLSAFAQQIPAMLLMWVIVYSIADRAGMAKKHKWITFMIVGICMTSSWGCIAVPWQFMGMIFLSTMTDATGITVNVLMYVAVWLLFTAATIVLYTLAGKFLLRIDVSTIENKDDIYADKRGTKMNEEQKRAWIVLIIFALLLLLPNFLPKDWPIISQLYTLSTTGAVVLVLIVIAFFRNSETGGAQYNLDALFQKSSQWSLLIMCAMVFPLINMLESDQAGVVTSLVNLILPVIENLGITTCIIVTALLLGCLTQFFHNLMLGLIFIPIGSTLMIQLGGSPVVMTLAISVALMSSLLTPAASTQSALMFGQVENTHKPHLYQFAFCAVAIGLICMALVMVPVSSMIW